MNELAYPGRPTVAAYDKAGIPMSCYLLVRVSETVQDEHFFTLWLSNKVRKMTSPFPDGFSHNFVATRNYNRNQTA